MRTISPPVSPNITAPYYHGSVTESGAVYVRGGAAGESRPAAHDPGALRADGGSVAVEAVTLIGPTAEGPFAPLAVALEREDTLRARFAAALPVPSLRAWSRLRVPLLVAAAVPVLVLLELDRELAGKDLLRTGRLVVDLVLALGLLLELARRVPRMPAVAGAALLAIGTRWCLIVARGCGKGIGLLVWASAGLALAAGVVVLARAPTRERVALELLDRLGISPAAAAAARREEPPGRARFLASLAVAAGLPLLLMVLRRAGAEIAVQGGAALAYAIVAPLALERFTPAGASASPPAPSPTRIDLRRTLLAVVAGLTVTAALVHGAHQFFETGTELARCTSKLDAESRRVLALEAAELARRLDAARASILLAAITAAAMPFVEERIFRGVLMDVLTRRYGRTYGLFASAAAFAVAHVGVYEVALYQTVLLGLAFGVAYAEGGVLAAFVVHALWNLLALA